MSEFPIIENPSRLKVVELKEELDKRGMPTSGLKKDLVTRLEEAQGLAQPPQTEEDKAYPEPAPLSTTGEDVDHATPADEVKDAAVPPKDISDSNPPAIDDPVHLADEHKEESKQDEEQEQEEVVVVGHVMVEGSPEKTAEIRQLEAEAIISPETKLIAELQPAALDPEVAAEIAKEEMKDTIPPSPGPVRSLSPLPAASAETEARPQTPPMDMDDDVLDLGEDGATSRKRGREAVDPAAAAPKRPKRRQFPPLPESLSHFVHPPTTCIYISNLRRPLLLPALHELLFPDYNEDEQETSKPSTLLTPPKAPFASESYPDIWLSGVKSHAYAVFDSVDSAVQTAKRIDGKVFPEETGSELKVDFVDEDEITRLVEREEQAWASGRQKLDLKITKDGDEYRFDLTSGASTSGGPGPARVTPRGQAAGPSSRGAFGMNGGGAGGSRPPPFGNRPLTGVNAMGPGPGPGSRGGPPPSRPYANVNGSNDRFSGPPPPRGLGPRDASPHFDRRAGPGGGDSYRPGQDDRGGNSYRPGGRDRDEDRRGGGDSYRPDGDDRRGDFDRRTDSRPNLSWREGPRR